jgi:hypothetical protein
MKNTINDYKIGQIVSIIVVKGSNAWRSVRDYGKSRIFNAIITKIGKKYITVETQNSDYVFDMTNNFYEKTDTCINFQLFPTREKAEEFVKSQDLEIKIRQFFNSFYSEEFTLEELTTIHNIIENAKRRENK